MLIFMLFSVYENTIVLLRPSNAFLFSHNSFKYGPVVSTQDKYLMQEKWNCKSFFWFTREYSVYKFSLYRWLDEERFGDSEDRGRETPVDFFSSLPRLLDRSTTVLHHRQVQCLAGNDAVCYDRTILHWSFSAQTIFVPSGLAEINILIDFLLHHSSFLLVILVGIIIIAACLLRGIFHNSRLNKLVVSSEWCFVCVCHHDHCLLHISKVLTSV